MWVFSKNSKHSQPASSVSSPSFLLKGAIWDWTVWFLSNTIFGLLGRRFWSEKLHKIHHCNHLQIFNSGTSVTFSVPNVHDFFSTTHSPNCRPGNHSSPLPYSKCFEEVLSFSCLTSHQLVKFISISCIKLAFYGWTSHCVHMAHTVYPLLYCSVTVDYEQECTDPLLFYYFGMCAQK